MLGGKLGFARMAVKASFVFKVLPTAVDLPPVYVILALSLFVGAAQLPLWQCGKIVRALFTSLDVPFVVGVNEKYNTIATTSYSRVFTSVLFTHRDE